MSTCTRCTGRLAPRDLDKVAKKGGGGRGGGDLTITASLFHNNNNNDNNNNSFGYMTSLVLDQCYMALFLPLMTSFLMTSFLMTSCLAPLLWESSRSSPFRVDGWKGEALAEPRATTEFTEPLRLGPSGASDWKHVCVQ